MNGSRDAVLGRIREALRVPAPHHVDVNVSHDEHGPTAEFREWLPIVGPTLEDRIELFAKLSEMLRTEFVVCNGMGAARKHLRQLSIDLGWKKVATHAGRSCTELMDNVGSFSVLNATSGYDKFELESCDAGVTECECLVAQTGSICVTTHSSGGRALSVLPPHHVVIARREQLVPDLTSAYDLLEKKYSAGYPSFISFISGPSRTGDIERILVLGAHGPKKLTVLLVP